MTLDLARSDGAAAAGGPVSELVRIFLRLGFIAFGGPAAHIAMMDDEIVHRRRWIERQHFLDLVGATNLIPGPNSTEMVMHIGYERAGWRGLVAAGCSFILPAAAITGIFGWLYVRYGSLPQVEPLLFGVKPAVIALILGAIWKLGKTAIKDGRLAAIGAAVGAAALSGFGEIAALLAGGVGGALWLRALSRGGVGSAHLFLPLPGLSGLGNAAAAAVATSSAAAGVSIGTLFLFFLKIGAVLYGSGYVLVAFLEGGLVREYGWLTQGQLLDAIAIGQFTPGPILSTATFIGYVIGGAPGAVAATVGIFLPSFLFVLVLNPLIPRMRASRWMSAFLDAVNVAAVALMVAVTIELGISTLTSWPAVVIATLAAVAALWRNWNAAWLVLGGAVLGLLLGPWAG